MLSAMRYSALDMRRSCQANVSRPTGERRSITPLRRAGAVVISRTPSTRASLSDKAEGALARTISFKHVICACVGRTSKQLCPSWKKSSSAVRRCSHARSRQSRSCSQRHICTGVLLCATCATPAATIKASRSCGGASQTLTISPFGRWK